MGQPEPVDAEDAPLSGGRMTSGIVRRGDTVRRPMGPWSPAVHELLRHLESVGFAGAPRVLGIDGDREVLTYLDGDVPVDPDWEPGRGNRLPPYTRSDHALAGVGELIARLHADTAGFAPTIRELSIPPGMPSRYTVFHGLFVDAYGLTDRRAIVPALTQCKLVDVERVKYWPVGTSGAAGALECIAGELRWLAANETELTRAL